MSGAGIRKQTLDCALRAGKQRARALLERASQSTTQKPRRQCVRGPCFLGGLFLSDWRECLDLHATTLGGERRGRASECMLVKRETGAIAVYCAFSGRQREGVSGLLPESTGAAESCGDACTGMERLLGIEGADFNGDGESGSCQGW